MIEAVCFEKEHVFEPSLFYPDEEVCKYCKETRKVESGLTQRTADGAPLPTCEHCGRLVSSPNFAYHICAPRRR